VRAVDVPAGVDAPGEVDVALEEPVVGEPAVDVPAASSLVVSVEPAVPCAEVVAADTDPENEQADSARTASSAAGTGRSARGREIVMAPR
jgi:hypothetical protein